MTPAPKSHLLSYDAMQLSVRRQRKFPEKAVRLLISLCGTIGTPAVMKGFFGLPLDIKSLAVFIVALSLFLRLLRRISPKLGFSGILLSFAAIPVLLVRYREAAVLGAGRIYHMMRKTILWRSSFPDLLPDHSGGWTNAQCVQFVFIMMSLALVALVEYSDVLLTHPHSSRSGFWIRFLVTFPFLECGLYFGLETSSIAVYMMLFFWVGTLLVSRRAVTKRMSEQQGASASVQTQFLADTEQHFTLRENGAVLLLLALTVFAAGTLFSTRHYIRSEEMNEKRQALRDWYRNITIDDVMDLIQQIPGSIGPDIVSDEVNLLQKTDLYFDGRPMLRLEIGAAATPDDYYLRGIVRSEYTGKGWAIPYSVYRKHLRLFRKLTTANRMPQTIFHSDHIEELRTSDGKFPVVRCNVEALGNETVNYLPYQSVFDIGTGYRYDIEIGLDSQKEYGFWILNNAKPDWAKFTAEEHSSSDPLVQKYEDFVWEQYLLLPETDEMEQLRSYVMPDMPAQNVPLNERLLAIRNYIWEHAEYTIQPGVQPQDQDFVTYFLEQSHKGYCAHYASAAVVLCRMCGIPARYCQGYVLTESNFRSAELNDNYEIMIPDDQAHAWAEIYVKGFGWVPYEFTETVYDSWHRSAETAPRETTIVTVTTTTTAVTTAADTAQTESNTTDPAAAAQTTTLTGTTGANGGNGGVGISPQFRKMLQVLLTVLGIALALLLYWVLHRLIVKRREREMHDHDPNRAAQASYQFIIKLLRIYGLEQKKLSHDEFAEQAENACHLLKRGRITRAITIQQAAVFSRSGISQTDAKAICKIAHDLASSMYQHAKPMRKLWLRWGRHIVA